ncbi:ankyrin repeat-containing domain protein [Gorgonomyces haynaldii]|nr:ankyrin repeat-containing domain protein [Gorgonomyces haynaldii]
MSLSSIKISPSISSLSNLDALNEEAVKKELGFDISDSIALERNIFTAINDGDREKLLKIFTLYPSTTTVLQLLLTTTYPNRDHLEHLNCIQISCILGDEELCLDILQFVTRVTEEIDARKVLYEFMGRVWGNGNTILHMAAFMGMADLVKRLLELGAAAGKVNERKYKPVDSNRLLRHECLEKPSTPIEEKTLKMSHSKSSSFEFPTEKPKEGGHKKTRSATMQSQERKIKPKKKVLFDPATLLLHVCQFPDSVEEPLKIVRECLGLGTNKLLDVNNTCTPHQWLTPLHVACTHGHLDIATLLLVEAHSCVNMCDKEGWTPLHCASAEGHVDILNLLGRCQGVLGQEGQQDWIHVPDGPIDLEPVNDDGEQPEDVALESKKAEIEALFQELKIKYPPPPREDEEIEEEELEDIVPKGPQLSHSYSIVARKHVQEQEDPKPRRMSLDNKSMIPKPIEIKEEEKLSLDDLQSRVHSIPVTPVHPIKKEDSITEEPLKVSIQKEQTKDSVKEESLIPRLVQSPENGHRSSDTTPNPAPKLETAPKPESGQKEAEIGSPLTKPTVNPGSPTVSPSRLSVETRRESVSSDSDSKIPRRTSRLRNSILGSPAAMAETSSGDFSWMDSKKAPQLPSPRRMSKTKQDKPEKVDDQELMQRVKSVKDRIKSFEQQAQPVIMSRQAKKV